MFRQRRTVLLHNETHRNYKRETGCEVHVLHFLLKQWCLCPFNNIYMTSKTTIKKEYQFLCRNSFTFNPLLKSLILDSPIIGSSCFF